jgi:hypothetical protein
MLDKSFFVSTEIHRKEVEMGDGTKHTLFFKELPYVEFRKFQLMESSDDPDVKVMSIAKMISASLCEENGEPAITLEQAVNLKPNVATKIFLAITDVNAPQKKD